LSLHDYFDSYIAEPALLTDRYGDVDGLGCDTNPTQWIILRIHDLDHEGLVNAFSSPIQADEDSRPRRLLYK
jgi:hypothetical protein